MDIDGIRKAILQNVAASSARLTPQYLEKTIMEIHGLDKLRARAVIKDLVTRGQLEYSYEFGSTYLVPSFNKPVRISAHVVVQPPGHRYRPAPDDVVIQIKPGAAFGGGRHPTTRLSVNAIEYVLKTASPDGLRRRGSVLDIGTGSGILAIAAVCLGIQKGLGIDIDPCAISEARENIALNNLESRIVNSWIRLLVAVYPVASVFLLLNGAVRVKRVIYFVLGTGTVSQLQVGPDTSLQLIVGPIIPDLLNVGVINTSGKHLNPDIAWCNDLIDPKISALLAQVNITCSGCGNRWRYSARLGTWGHNA